MYRIMPILHPYLISLLFLIPSSEAATTQPNIVIIVADDLGYNDVSWHNPVVKTPHLEELAREGVLLEQHYSQPICTPTRAALLSGRYPFHIGLQRKVIKPLNPWGLLTNLTTLADELKSAGYATHAVGKWHLGFCKEDYLPTSRGFDHHYGYWVGSEDYYNHTRGEGSRGHKMGYDFRNDLEVDETAKGVYSSILFSQKSDQILSNHDQSKPLFLYLPFQSVHAPFEAPQEYIDMYEDVSDDQRRIFLGMITAMDDAVGVVVESLKNAGMFDNTIIVFFSDNGGALGKGNNWPLRGHKSTLWEGGTRTPAFVRGPGLSPRTEERMFHVTDWYPTLLEVLNKTPSGPPMDGVAEWRGLVDSSEDWVRHEMVYNIKTEEDHPHSPTAAIRVGDWKFLWRVTDASWEKPPEGRDAEDPTPCPSDKSRPALTKQLFNLAEDPLEETNLADIEVERADEMKSRLKDHLETYMDVDYNHDDPAGKPSNFGGFWSTGWC